MARRILIGASVACSLLAVGALVGPAHAAAPATAVEQRKPTAAVSLGDSYLSGVAGRWKGNSLDASGSRAGTDRAWRAGADGEPDTYDPARVYGDSAANGCFRSDVAPIVSARLRVDRSINLACSGAQTRHVLRAEAGGEPYNGEAPQNDQLATVARTHDVKLVVVTVGGNDLGFGRVVAGCVAQYLRSVGACNTTQQSQIEQRLPVMADTVGHAVDDIHATLAAAGYERGSYKLVVQSYPSPLPSAADLRYPGPGRERQTLGGCPLYDEDVDWAQGWLVPALNRALAQAARAHGAQFLDVSAALRGHELCAKRVEQSTGQPRSATSEWVRFADLSGQQSGLGDALHPNYYGQRAMGRCLWMAARTTRDVACRAVPGLPWWGVYVVPLTR